jgi:hypothetical protein
MRPDTTNPEPQPEEAFTPWAPCTIKGNTPKETEKRIPTILKLGPPRGTLVEVQLKPAEGDHAPLTVRNKIDKHGNFYFKGGYSLPLDWPGFTRGSGKRASMSNATDYLERHRVLAEPAERENKIYLRKIPDRVPKGEVVVHNNARPTAHLSSRGFRAWRQSPTEALEKCDCGWAPDLPEHYRVKGIPPRAEPEKPRVRVPAGSKRI